MRKSKLRNGFTLPEILVTVTVVAVLAAVVVPAVTQYINKGDAPASSQDIAQVRTAITGYIADTRHYPATLQDLVTAPAGVSGWKGPYFAGQLSSSAATATFTSGGSNITLGPTLSQSPTGHTGYLTTAIVLGAGTTCQDLWNLDKVVDGTTPTAANAVANAGTGNLQWAGACNVTTANGSDAAGSNITSGVLRVTAIGG